MIELKNVTVGFGGATPALAEICLSVGDGSRHLVCGAAGSGKSTLLQTASGMIPRLIAPPDFEGSVSFSGTPMDDIGKEQLFSEIGIVLQNVEDQLWDLSVEDLIAFPLENRGLERAEIRQRLADLIEEFRLHDLTGRRVLSLSGGARRMVAIAAAVAAAPKMLVLDEPTTGLDPEARIRLVDMLDRRSDESLLIAEQDPASVERITQTVSLLAAGRLSEPTPIAGIIDNDTRWLAAGLLPPRRTSAEKHIRAPGETLLSVSSLKTALSRANGEPVLKDIGFKMAAGEAVALIGRNGAGKTTLFQSILGLAKTDAGSVTIGGEDAGDWTVARRARKIAYLPQNMRRVLFNMTVREEVLFAVTGGGKADDTAGERAKAALEKYGLSDLAESNPFALSARQQAVLGLACADASQSLVAILDEPLLARDVAGRRMLQTFMDTMLDGNRAILLISHDLELVDDVASRILVLDGGVIAGDGTPETIWNGEAFERLGWPRPQTVKQEEAPDALS